MLRSIVALVLMSSAACLPPPASAAEQTTGSDVAAKADDAWQTLKNYSVDKKNEAVAYGKQLLKDTDAKIDQLQAKAASASGDAKRTYERQIDELKVVRGKTAAKLEQMEKATGAAWNEAKRGFADAYRDLERAYDRAVGKSK